VLKPEEGTKPRVLYIGLEGIEGIYVRKDMQEKFGQTQRMARSIPTMSECHTTNSEN